MLRLALFRALAMAAFFAVTWVVPWRAYAAIIPVCDGDAVSGWSPVVLSWQPEAHTAEDCPASTAPADEAAPQDAAMCDAQAATVVAPSRIHPQSDARIDAVTSCEGIQKGPVASPSGNDHGPHGVSWAHIDPAMLTEPTLVRPRMYFVLPSMPAVIGEPRAGFDREVYHPPRT